jgi:hypothetical protein
MFKGTVKPFTAKTVTAKREQVISYKELIERN